MKEVAVAPAMKVAMAACLVMLVMVMVEKVAMGLASSYAKVFRRRPQRIYACEPLEEDEELGTLAYPMVLVQIPMYNEKEVYQLSINAACNLTWPADRVIIQVLDDSTEPIIKELIQDECEKWRKGGKNIRYEIRNNRHGYKAGALRIGMTHAYVQQCEFVAIFDADFQPEHDFLIKTIPFLVRNSEIALVQARWKFVNANECLMTRLQEMTMDYHFKVEQEAGSTACSFFGFNGTAGVWRIHAINEAGGWQDRTTVEDMDLAVRASLKGWKFVYVGSIKVKSELPSTFKAYRCQQHRWSCGPAVLFKKVIWDIALAKQVSLLKKFYIIYSFFLARRIGSHMATFFLYCVVVPLSIFFPEFEIPKWGMIYLPTAISLLNAVGTPRSVHLIVFWVLFENVMALHRCKAVFIGLCEAGRSNEWIVTQKLGDTLKAKRNPNTIKSLRRKFWERLHHQELVVGVLLIICACYDYKFRHNYFFVYFSLQGIAFLVMGFGYIGTVIPSNK
ncbi:Glucomannan 4-beta-mannosyltransferase 9 [Apostasia shenzhenica]|uniref:glucomannan 4-beta-mannosyltransferase n=1 Tax=Apostasia shenzhenica TaxID=1088818 RepID=A0A2I0BFS0_9ASPA|nr:Glucomannan 4-beta-mannosyltransferase 9 [Apostasia shenzhenica]